MELAKKLPFTFDVEALTKEYHSIPESVYADLSGSYEKENRLFRLNLVEPEFVPEMDRAPEFLPIDLLKERPEMLRIYNTIQSPMETYRIHRMAPHKSIDLHRDVALSWDHGAFRIHVPIITNDKVEFLQQGKPVVMKPGECWYLNVDVEHEVHNRSDEWRIHLILDCRRNAWWEEVMASA